MSFVDILFIIVVLALLVAGIAYYFHHRYQQQIDELNDRIEQLLAIPVNDQLYTLRNLELSGQTKRKYESLNATWQTLKNFKLNEIEQSIVGAIQLSEQFNVFKVRGIIEQTSKLLDETEVQVYKLNEDLEELLDISNQNTSLNEKLLERYNNARKNIMKHSFDYGPAIETLETNIQHLELNFTRYNELMTNGDYIEAEDMLKTIESDLSSLEQILTRIPKMYDTIKNDYEESLADLRQGYEQMIKEKFVFEEDNILEEIEAIQESLNNAKSSIKNADLMEAQTLMDKANRDIDTLYDYMEAEIEAKVFVVNHIQKLRQKFDAVNENNRYARVEVDRIAQSYILHEDELDKINTYNEKINQQYMKMVDYNEAMDNNQVVYSKLAGEIEKIDRQIGEIDEKQQEIVANLTHLTHQEREARSNLDLFELDIRNMKRRLEKANLPGLNKAYYDLFYKVSDEIEFLAQKLNQVRIDMKEIQQLESNLSEKMAQLDEQTEKILDNATLTEYMIQHSNRFRYDYPEMGEAIEDAEYLFYDEFRYEEALNIIERALYRIDPEGPTQVRRMYHHEKNNRLF